MTMPSLPEPYTEQVEEYSGIAMNKVVRTPLFNADQMRAYGDARAAAATELAVKDHAALCDRFYARGMNAAECAAAIRGCD